MIIHNTERGSYIYSLPLFKWAERQRIAHKFKQQHSQLINRYGVSPGMAAAIENNCHGGANE